MDDALLDVKNLRVSFSGMRSTVQAVRGISFSLRRQKVGIVGESGSGKSMTGRAILRLTPKTAQVEADRMHLGGIDILAMSEARMRQIRGGHASMILQDPKYSLNPLMQVGQQIAEAYRLHHHAPRAEARERALAMLEAVHIRDPQRVYNQYPHEISGGMGQRIMIAMMLIPEPQLIIADEPTSALDVTVRNQVLTILEEQLERRQAGLLFISHDLNLVAEFCDRVLVMYAGRIVEDLPAEMLGEACHPYTRALLTSLPGIDHPTDVLKVPERSPDWLDGPVYVNGRMST